jgi:hypothetical protein
MEELLSKILERLEIIDRRLELLSGSSRPALRAGAEAVTPRPRETEHSMSQEQMKPQEEFIEVLPSRRQRRHEKIAASRAED